MILVRLMLALVTALVVTSPASAEWLRAESPHFIVYSRGSDDRLRQRVTQLEDFDALLRRLTGVRDNEAPTKLEVYIVRGTRELGKVRPVSSITAGFYAASPGAIAAFIDERSEGDDLHTLYHEYAHHFMRQYFPAAYPGWYVEGFAEYLMTAKLLPDRMELGRASRDRAVWLNTGSLLSTQRMLTFYDQKEVLTFDVIMFYAQAWLMTHYFYQDDERRAQLGRYLTAVAEGKPTIEAFTSAVAPLKEFDKALANYIRGRRILFQRAPRASAAAPPQITVSQLKDSADDLLLLDVAVRLGPPEEEKDDLLKEVRENARKFPNDGFARKLQALAEAKLGDRGAADTILTSLMTTAADDPALAFIKGMRHLTAFEAGEDPAANARQAKLWLAKAHQGDPNHNPTLYGYALSLKAGRDYASENTTNILLLARELAPQVEKITLTAAHVLMSRGMFKEALALLGPVAADVHSPGGAATAKGLIKLAEAGEKPGPLKILTAEEAAASTAAKD